MWNAPTEYGDAWNFGPYDNDIIPVKKVVETVIKTWGEGRIKVNKSELHEARLLKLDISKSMFKLRWKPTYNADESVEKTVEWYRKFYDGKTDMRKLTRNQINEYIEKSVLRGLK
jgi:CDP-glucose 4,6-dehydratase